jgi:SWI/SNF-related matrix-associated actin-dependent regulator 1 of chromatin subfamily A
MTKPFRFQEEGVGLINHFKGRALLADEMGLGKTLQALLHVNRNKKMRPVIIVCPASLRGVWEFQAMHHLNIRVDVVTTRAIPKRSLIPPEIVVISYDLLPYWLETLKKMKPKIVIADEVHYVKSLTAKRTRALSSLVKVAKHFIAISGTPLINRPFELYPVLKMLNGRIWKSPGVFGRKFCGAKYTQFGWDFSGCSRSKLLHRLLKKRCMIRRLKKDVLKDLPPKIRNIVPIKLTKEQMAEYREARDDLIGWLRKNYGGHRAMRASKADAIVKVGYLKRLVAKLKLDAVTEWIENFIHSGEKLIAFGVHRAIMGELVGSFWDRCALVTGEVPAKERETQFNKFNTHKECRVFLGNIQAAGTGWSAKKSSNVAFVELAWTPGEMTQCEDRAHGIGRGQKGVQMMSHWLIAQGTIEEKICQMLQNKDKNLNAILDGGNNVYLDVFDELVKELLKESK